MTPLVSILIPVYNREKLVSKAIESAINQTYGNLEIIIGDNCSTDGTWTILEQYSKNDSRIKIFQNKSNLGPVGNWLECLNNASGKYTKILFSDDWMNLDFVEKTVDILHKDPEIGFVISDIEVISNNKVFKLDFGLGKKVSSKKYLENALINNHLPVSPGAAMFRSKDLASNLLYFIPNILDLKCEEYGAGNDLLIYLLTANQYKYIYISNSTKVFFLAHNDSFTISENLEYYYVVAKLYFYEKTRNTFFANFIIYLYFNKISDSNYRLLYNEVKCDFNIFVLMNIVLKKMCLKFTNYFKHRLDSFRR